jgi:Fe-S-cluster containining protein
LVLRNAVDWALGRRVHVRALAEALIAHGVFSRDELEAKLAAVWRRDAAVVVAEIWQLVPSPIDLVSEEELCTECGAACCKSAAIMLTPAEADTLRRRARELGIADLEIFSAQGGDLGGGDPYREPRWTMPAFPCVFLAENRCVVYADRPLHCANHPTYWREECTVSWRRYHRMLALPRRASGAPPADFVARLLSAEPRC